MTALAPARVGWCPGALRPMATGDGLLVRLKPRGGILPLQAAAAIAELALRHGNGALDLTARANLQIRGVSDRSLPPLLDGLGALGLMDANPEAEAIRNIVASPLPQGVAASGMQGRAVDIAPIVAGLEATIAATPDLWRLPAKWSVVVDDGGPLSLRAVAADLRFEALPDGRVAVCLADELSYAACRAIEVPAVAEALCRVALAAGPARMDEIVRERGNAAVFQAASLQSVGVLPPRPITVAQDVVGLRAGADVLGLAPPFGHLEARHLLALAASAIAQGAADLRLTPWRVILLTGLMEAGAAAVAESLPRETWITAPNDARLAVAACTGQPACHRGSTPVPDHAATVAHTLRLSAARTGIAVHVSGCAKGCAHPHPAPATLVGRDGRYDLVLGGKASDKPVANGLSLEAALRRIGADLS